ncbi:hypothetical protein GSF24_31205, partial [Microbispora triticiradicis]|nr:hypothetical protein [Microbispora triticiradicis]
MDLFDTDPEHLRRSNDNGDGDWWDQLTANSPLWSSEGALAREYVPIVDPDVRKHARRFNDSTKTPNFARAFETRGGNASDTEFTGDETASGVSPDDVGGACSDDPAAAPSGALAGDPGGFPGSASGPVPGGASDGASGAGQGDAGRARDAGRGQNAGPDRDAEDAPGGVSDGAAGAGRSGAGPDRDACGAGGAGGASSWVAVAAVGEAARVVALVPVPESAQVCLAEAEELLAARDRITSALAARVGRVHRAG